MSGFNVDNLLFGQPVRAADALIRVGVIESNDLLRDSLVALMSADARFEVTGSWSDSQEAVEELAVNPPDILLLSLKLADRAGLEALKSILTVNGRTRVIATVDCNETNCMVLHPQLRSASHRSVRMISQAFAEPDDCLQTALKSGAHGVLRLRCKFEHVAEAIRRVHAGRVSMEPATATRLAQQFLHAIHAGPTATDVGSGSLTLRERQVVTLIAQGRSNKEIAGELQVSYSTVKNHVSSVLDKLDLTDRTQLAVYAMDHALPVTEFRSDPMASGCPAARAANGVSYRLASQSVSLAAQ